jgi:hypothetical protein
MKKHFVLFLFLCLQFTSALCFDLQNGDVLLISFNCYECRVIESETNSPFSHSGVIIKNELHALTVGQSLGSVALYPIEQFLKNKTPGSVVAVYRPKEFLSLPGPEKVALEEKMLSLFNSQFAGSLFDRFYLWDNVDSNGRELLYCSEFIAKYLDHFLSTPTIPFPLSYKKNEAYWKTYFKGLIPEGELGNSPASFAHDERFVFMGNLSL